MLTDGELMIRLRKPEEEDVDIALEWFKKSDHFMGDALPVSSVSLSDMALGLIKAPSSYDSNDYLVIEAAEGPVGMALFHSINWKDRNAVMEIHLLPEKTKDNYALDAFHTAVLFAFQELNLHKICIYHAEDETEDDLIRIAEKAGAQKEQILKKHLCRKDKYYDVCVYGLLRSEYDNS